MGTLSTYQIHGSFTLHSIDTIPGLQSHRHRPSTLQLRLGRGAPPHRRRQLISFVDGVMQLFRRPPLSDASYLLNGPDFAVRLGRGHAQQRVALLLHVVVQHPRALVHLPRLLRICVHHGNINESLLKRST
jgi:hypothetical protein